MAYTFRMMEDELQITLTNDYAFKRLLGSEENKPLLQDLLECILDLSAEDVSELELMDKELTKEELSDKTGILDVKLKLTNGTVIDIEISFSDRHPCLSENTSFGIAKTSRTDRMSVVPNRSEFFVRKTCSSRMCRDAYS